MTYQRRNTRGAKFVFDPSFLMQALPFVTNYLSGWTQNKLSGISGNKSDILKQVSYVLDFLHAAVDSGEFTREAKEAEQTLEKLYDDVIQYVDRDGNLPDDIINDKAFDKIVDVAADAVSALDGVQDFTVDKLDELKHLFSSEKGFYMKSVDLYSYTGINAAANLMNDWINDLGVEFDYEFESSDFVSTPSVADEIFDILAQNIKYRDLSDLENELVMLTNYLWQNQSDMVTFRVIDILCGFIGSALVWKRRFY